MHDLADVYSYFHDAEAYESGMITAMAFNDPKELQKLNPVRQAVERVIEQVDMGDLPGMLRIPKKHPEADSNGG